MAKTHPEAVHIFRQFAWNLAGTLAGVKAVCRFAFQQLGLHRVEAACLPQNAPSAALLLKAGFEEEGYAKAYLKIDGDWRDHRLFGLLSPELQRR